MDAVDPVLGRVTGWPRAYKEFECVSCLGALTWRGSSRGDLRRSSKRRIRTASLDAASIRFSAGEHWDLPQNFRRATKNAFVVFQKTNSRTKAFVANGQLVLIPTGRATASAARSASWQPQKARPFKHTRSNERRRATRRNAFSLAKASSIGLKSGRIRRYGTSGERSTTMPHYVDAENAVGDSPLVRF